MLATLIGQSQIYNFFLFVKGLAQKNMAIFKPSIYTL